MKVPFLLLVFLSTLLVANSSTYAFSSDLTLQTLDVTPNSYTINVVTKYTIFLTR